MFLKTLMHRNEIEHQCEELRRFQRVQKNE